MAACYYLLAKVEEGLSIGCSHVFLIIQSWSTLWIKHGHVLSI